MKKRVAVSADFVQACFSYLKITHSVNMPEKFKKDPNAPKRPLSAYFKFCNDHREEVKKSNTEKKIAIFSFIKERDEEVSYIQSGSCPKV